MDKKTLYFPNLNGLRFLAAFMVIVHHYEYSRNCDFTTFYGRMVLNAGPIGVILFFSLSSFLVTYLLLQEKKSYGSISVRKFYIRRMLRILPLYFLIVIGALFVFNNIKYIRIPGISYASMSDHFTTKAILYLSVLPNFANAGNLTLPFADQTWSLGVEEQFYLCIPLAIRGSKKYVKLFLTIFIAYLLLRLTCYLLISNSFFNYLYTFISRSCFSVMALGSLASVYVSNNKVNSVIYSRSFQLLTYALLLGFLLFSVNIPYLNFEIYAVLFLFCILNLALNKNSIVNLENKLFHYLGKISYGLYMYHFLAIRLCEIIGKKFLFLNSHWVNLVLVIGVTIGLSACSYHFFESYFISKKRQFSKIISGNTAA